MNKTSTSMSVIIYVGFCLSCLIGNVLMSMKPAWGEIAENVGGLVFLFIFGIIGFGGILPLYCRKKGLVEFPLWPRPKHIGTVLFLWVVILLFAKYDQMKEIVIRQYPLTTSLLVFLGLSAMHFGSMAASIGVLYPMLKRRFPLPVAILLAAASFPLYHWAQYHNFPQGLSAPFQVELLIAALGYVLFYEWSESFLFTYFLQHCYATVSVVYMKKFDFGAVDEPFFISVIFVGLIVIYGVFELTKQPPDGV